METYRPLKAIRKHCLDCSRDSNRAIKAGRQALAWLYEGCSSDGREESVRVTQANMNKTADPMRITGRAAPVMVRIIAGGPKATPASTASAAAALDRALREPTNPPTSAPTITPKNDTAPIVSGSIGVGPELAIRTPLAKMATTAVRKNIEANEKPVCFTVLNLA